MRNRSWVMFGVVIVGGWIVAQIASPLWGQQEAAADAKTSAASSETEKELDVRYAKAYRSLTEATLHKYEDTNRRAPNTIRPTIMQGLQESVRKARERVQMAEGDEKNHGDIYVVSAEAELRLAEQALRSAEDANRRRSGTILQGEVDRLKAQRDLAVVRVDKAKHLASESPLSNVRFELEQLREEVHELRLLVALLRFRN